VLDGLAVYPPQIAAGLAILAFGVWYAVRTNGGPIDQSLPLAGACPGLSWTDYYASADPVSNGRIISEQPPSPPGASGPAATAPGLPARCHEVYLKGSLLSDHDGYLANQDQVLPWLLNDLVAAAYPAADGDQPVPGLVSENDIKKARTRRRHLIDWLIAARALTLAVAVAMWRLTAARALSGPVNHAMRVAGLQASIGSLTARLAVIAAVMIAVYILIGIIPWKTLENRSYREFFRAATRHGDLPHHPSGPGASPIAKWSQRHSRFRRRNMAAKQGTASA
jgi:hypothetical protein